MSTLERITVTLTSDMAESVRAAVAAGDYASSSEIVREALRDWRHKRAVLERELAELRHEIGLGLADLEAGRVDDFDPAEIIKSGEQASAGCERSA